MDELSDPPASTESGGVSGEVDVTSFALHSAVFCSFFLVCASLFTASIVITAKHKQRVAACTTPTSAGAAGGGAGSSSAGGDPERLDFMWYCRRLSLSLALVNAVLYTDRYDALGLMPLMFTTLANGVVLAGAWTVLSLWLLFVTRVLYRLLHRDHPPVLRHTLTAMPVVFVAVMLPLGALHVATGRRVYGIAASGVWGVYSTAYMVLLVLSYRAIRQLFAAFIAEVRHSTFQIDTTHVRDTLRTFRWFLCGLLPIGSVITIAVMATIALYVTEPGDTQANDRRALAPPTRMSDVWVDVLSDTLGSLVTALFAWYVWPSSATGATVAPLLDGDERGSSYRTSDHMKVELSTPVIAPPHPQLPTPQPQPQP